MSAIGVTPPGTPTYSGIGDGQGAAVRRHGQSTRVGPALIGLPAMPPGMLTGVTVSPVSLSANQGPAIRGHCQRIREVPDRIGAARQARGGSHRRDRPRGPLDENVADRLAGPVSATNRVRSSLRWPRSTQPAAPDPAIARRCPQRRAGALSDPVGHPHVAATQPETDELQAIAPIVGC